MEFDITLLISYLTPIIAAVGTFIAAVVKILQLTKSNTAKIEEATNKLAERLNITEQQKQMNQLLKENAELKRMLKREIELQTRVRYEDDTTNKKV